MAAAVVREAVAEDLAEGYRDMDARELRRLTQVAKLLYFVSCFLRMCPCKYLELHKYPCVAGICVHVLENYIYLQSYTCKGNKSKSQVFIDSLA